MYSMKTVLGGTDEVMLLNSLSFISCKASEAEERKEETIFGTFLEGAKQRFVMGYGCTICDECLEIPAPDYQQADQDAAGFVLLAELDQPGPSVGPRGGRGRARGRGQNSRSPRKGGKVVREIARTDVVVTPCGHLFHQTCIARWIKDKNTMNCPSCRKPCTPAKLLRTFPSVVLYHPAIDEDFHPQQAQPGASIKKEMPTSSSAAIPKQLELGSSTGIPRPAVSPTRCHLTIPAPPQPMPVAQVVAANNPVAGLQIVEVQDDDEDGLQIVNHNNGPNAQPGNCNHPLCVDRDMIRRTLEQDFDDLQNRYTDVLDDNNIKQAQLSSCEETIKALQEEIETLRKEKEELAGRPGTNPLLVKKRLPTTATAAANDTAHPPPKRRRANERDNDDNPPAGGNYDK